MQRKGLGILVIKMLDGHSSINVTPSEQHYLWPMKPKIEDPPQLKVIKLSATFELALESLNYNVNLSECFEAKFVKNLNYEYE
jgi:hypothetical protein